MADVALPTRSQTATYSPAIVPTRLSACPTTCPHSRRRSPFHFRCLPATPLRAICGFLLIALLAICANPIAAADTSGPAYCATLTAKQSIPCYHALAQKGTQRAVKITAPDGINAQCAAAPAPLRWLCAWIVNNRPEYAGRSTVVFSKHHAANGAVYWRTSVTVSQKTCSLPAAPDRWTYQVFSAALTKAGCAP